jgi:hypothetical protein
LARAETRASKRQAAGMYSFARKESSSSRMAKRKARVVVDMVGCSRRWERVGFGWVMMV